MTDREGGRNQDPNRRHTDQEPQAAVEPRLTTTELNRLHERLDDYSRRLHSLIAALDLNGDSTTAHELALLEGRRQAIGMCQVLLDQDAPGSPGARLAHWLITALVHSYPNRPDPQNN